VAPHRTPDDPYEWPEGSESALGMAERAGSGTPSSTGAQPGDPSSDPLTRQSSSASSVPNPDQPETPLEPDAELGDAEDFRPRAALTFHMDETSARRGTPLRLSGTVRAEGDPCPFSRVDVSLEAEGLTRVFSGALPSDEDGDFAGQVTIPLSVDVGDYSVSVSTPGTAQCAPSE
jgi:hypothetical protein